MSLLFDNHGRALNYVRLAITDRCNLRCFYCMPEKGIRYIPKKDLLSFEEIERLLSLLASMGINKVRLTGGEPFLRNDLMQLLARIVEIRGIQHVHLTTNGTLTYNHIPQLKKIGIASVNLSLDTLDKERFKQITHRDAFDTVQRTLFALLEHDIPVKINAVVMDDKNIDDIVPLIELSKNNPIDIRFIEEMPFNGEGNHYHVLRWTYKEILEYVRKAYPTLVKIKDPANATASQYQIPGYRGNVGIIAAFSRTFCGSCNRIRITAQGLLKTCLYDHGVLDIKHLLRSSADDVLIREKLLAAFSSRAVDGFEAEQKRHQAVNESMSTIGG